MAMYAAVTAAAAAVFVEFNEKCIQCLIYITQINHSFKPSAEKGCLAARAAAAPGSAGAGPCMQGTGLQVFLSWLLLRLNTLLYSCYDIVLRCCCFSRY